MPEPETVVVEEKLPVVEVPKPPKTPAPTEQEITETYIEKRKEGKTEDLPIPPPTVQEVVPEPPKAADGKPLTDQQAVDAYLAEREGRERKKRGGKQARIDELTKEKAEAEQRALQAEEARKTAEKTIEETKKLIPPPESKIPEAVKSAPKMEDFGTDASAYQAALALWVAEQSKPKESPPPEPIQQIRKEEFDRFLEKGKQFVSTHPDFNTMLEAAHVRGLTMTEEARIMITRMAAPEVAYWLAKPENDMAARAFMQMDAALQVVEVGKIAERLHVSPADFISSAPPPGMRLTGNNVRHEVPLSEITDTDEYIRQRRLQKRNGRGR